MSVKTTMQLQLQLPLLLTLEFTQISCDCGWLRCTVVERRSLTGELSLVYARLAADQRG